MSKKNITDADTAATTAPTTPDVTKLAVEGGSDADAVLGPSFSLMSVGASVSLFAVMLLRSTSSSTTNSLEKNSAACL